MIKRYVCQCLNVSIETLPSPVTDSSRDQLFNQIETSSLSEISKRDFLKNKFNELCLEINTNNYIDLTAIKYPEFFNLNLKFPLLTGYSIETISTSGDLKFKLNKCLICNLFTHLIAVTTNNIVTADNTSNSTLSHSSLSASESSDTISTKNVTTETSSSFSYNFYLLVNTNQMKMVNNSNDMSELKTTKNYSRLYDIILDKKFKELDNELENNLFGLDSLFNMESEIGKKVFLNRIEETLHQHQKSNPNESANEETFKIKLMDLVNSFITNNNSNTASMTASNINVIQENKSKKKSKEMVRARRARQYDNENVLSSSVFEMEELDEASSGQCYLFSDEDASNEEETTTTTTGIEDENLLEHLKNNVLKKRNSNVDEDATSDSNKLNKMLIHKNKLNKDLLNSNKYSCSLPRDIPVMQSGRMSTLKNIVNQSSEEENRADNENHYFTNEKVDYQKRHKSRNNMTLNRHTQSMSASFRNQNTNDDDSESSPINNDLYEGDDELFEDDNNNTVNSNNNNNKCLEDEDEANTKNMGQAISHLASSIVIKDGRELFGGVPSRRVPINSISKSCFE